MGICNKVAGLFFSVCLWYNGTFLNEMKYSQNLTLTELESFRTRVCGRKATSGRCENGECCPFSHCISWNRRNPFEKNYQPTICPDVMFSVKGGKMCVKNSCPRGRSYTYSHTKEEQMYHPSVYKSRACRDWPRCEKYFCPFGEFRFNLQRSVNKDKTQHTEKKSYARKSVRGKLPHQNTPRCAT
eukprot:Lankesteria_metandrocarpae@DN3473_c0_g1_i1.p2